MPMTSINADTAPDRTTSTPNPAPQGAEVLVCMHVPDPLDSLASTVERVTAVLPNASILLIDETFGVTAAGLARDGDRVHVLRPTSTRGTAMVDAFSWALDRGFSRIVEMSGDGAHVPESLPALIAQTETYGVGLVIGSRYAPGGRVQGRSARRKMISRTANRYVTTALRLPVRDSTSGFRVYTDDALRSAHLETVATDGPSWRIEMVRRIHRQNWLVLETPVTFRERVAEQRAGRRTVVDAFTQTACWAISGKGAPIRPIGVKFPRFH